MAHLHSGLAASVWQALAAVSKVSLATAPLHSGHVTNVSGNAHLADLRKVIKQRDRYYLIVTSHLCFKKSINKQVRFCGFFSVLSFINITLSLKILTFSLSSCFMLKFCSLSNQTQVSTFSFISPIAPYRAHTVHRRVLMESYFISKIKESWALKNCPDLHIQTHNHGISVKTRSISQKIRKMH